jgi:IMP cyclohydrolase
MKNPNGPYPGRQLFVGLTQESDPCFAYFVSGRSPESRQRKAVQIENLVRIGPLGSQAYDPLRHYSAVIFDNASGLMAVSNGIQTEAIFETYKLLFNTSSAASPDHLQRILEGAGAEPDSYHTPRIAGLITADQDNLISLIGLKTHGSPARVQSANVTPGFLVGVSTYRGEMDTPVATQPADPLPRLEFKWQSAEELARFVFDISAVLHNGNDIRVCSVGGIRKGKAWEIAIWNAY